MTPESLWRLWIGDIVRDPSMDGPRIIAHVRKHVQNHMPDEGDSKERWEEWLAGAYNLLAILGAKFETDPPHVLGIDLLHRKWLKAPCDHTPPPVSPTKVPKPKKNSGGSGS